MSQSAIVPSPSSVKTLVLIAGVSVAGCVIVGTVGAVTIALVGLRGSDSQDRAGIINAAAEFLPTDMLKAAVAFIQ